MAHVVPMENVFGPLILRWGKIGNGLYFDISFSLQLFYDTRGLRCRGDTASATTRVGSKILPKTKSIVTVLDKHVDILTQLRDRYARWIYRLSLALAGEILHWCPLILLPLPRWRSDHTCHRPSGAEPERGCLHSVLQRGSLREREQVPYVVWLELGIPENDTNNWWLKIIIPLPWFVHNETG